MMKAYRVEKQIAANGELKLSVLPFKEGDKVSAKRLPFGIQLISGTGGFPYSPI